MGEVVTNVDAGNSLLTTIDGVLDASLVKQTNIESLITTLDGVQDNALTKLGEIETSCNALISANHTDLVALEASLTSMESKMDTDNVVYDNQLTKLTEIDTAIDTIDAVLDAIKIDTEAIETAVESIATVVKAEDTAHSSGHSGIMSLAVRQDSQSDFGADGDYVPLSINGDGELRVTSGSGSTTMTVDTLMDDVSITANGTTNSSVFTKPKDVQNFSVLATSASGTGGFTLRKSYSVDGNTYIEIPMNQNGDSSRQVHITESLASFKFYRYAITNVELGSVNHTIKVCY